MYFSSGLCYDLTFLIPNSAADELVLDFNEFKSFVILQRRNSRNINQIVN